MINYFYIDWSFHAQWLLVVSAACVLLWEIYLLDRNLDKQIRESAGKNSS